LRCCHLINPQKSIQTILTRFPVSVAEGEKS
jgi:hypothetical protein